jgi:hypothetical protein
MNMIARDMVKAPQFGSDEARWQAVIDRDCRADGAFANARSSIVRRRLKHYMSPTGTALPIR